MATKTVRIEIPILLYADVEIDDGLLDEDLAAYQKVVDRLGAPEDHQVISIDLGFDGMSHVTIGLSGDQSCDSEKHFQIVDEDE